MNREEFINEWESGRRDFSYQYLVGIDLSEMNLIGVKFAASDLSNAILNSADLSGANLRGASLRNASLRNVDLRGEDLRYADLRGADLTGASLHCADLLFAKFSEDEKIRKGIILKEPMIGYKKCREKKIVTLEIPKGAVVFSINNGKCRTNKAKVVSITNLDGSEIYKEGRSSNNYNFKYEVGKEYEIENFDLMYNVECSTGIHFFRTREEAENYHC